jgi:hypothetical protein
LENISYKNDSARAAQASKLIRLAEALIGLQTRERLAKKVAMAESIHRATGRDWSGQEYRSGWWFAPRIIATQSGLARNSWKKAIKF